MTSEKNSQIDQSQDAFKVLYDLSQLLHTGLNQETLKICIALCNLGVEPTALAAAIKEIRKMGENAAKSKQLNSEL